MRLEFLRQSAKVVGAEKSEASNNLKVRVVHHKTKKECVVVLALLGGVYQGGYHEQPYCEFALAFRSSAESSQVKNVSFLVAIGCILINDCALIARNCN